MLPSVKLYTAVRNPNLPLTVTPTLKNVHANFCFSMPVELRVCTRQTDGEDLYCVISLLHETKLKINQ